MKFPIPCDPSGVECYVQAACLVLSVSAWIVAPVFATYLVGRFWVEVWRAWRRVSK